MKYIILFLLTFPAFSAVHTVQLKGMKFVPSELNVSVNDTVVFVNKENMLHNVVSPKNRIRSKLLRKGQKFQYKFTKTGTVEYFCEPHKSMGMKGKVNVQKGR